MSRRRRNTGLTSNAGHDPGKDLFAYLFLLMVIFVFVLLMTLHQVQADANLTRAPDRQLQGQSSLKSLDQKQFGTLVKDKGQLVLRFGAQTFYPQRDIEQLLTSPYLVQEQDEAGQTRKTLYLDARQQQPVLLGEYLAAFQALSTAGISVAFAERAK